VSGRSLALHFRETTPGIRVAVQRCFRKAPEKLYFVLEMCLAQLVGHEKWLRENLPRDHLVWGSCLW
jgi:hypothetical protein